MNLNSQIHWFLHGIPMDLKIHWLSVNANGFEFSNSLVFARNSNEFENKMHWLSINPNEFELSNSLVFALVSNEFENVSHGLLKMQGHCCARAPDEHR